MARIIATQVNATVVESSHENGVLLSSMIATSFSVLRSKHSLLQSAKRNLFTNALLQPATTVS